MKLFGPKNTNTIGQRGENIAVNHLEKQGYTIVATNFKNDYGRRLGEIDIIAKEKDCLVFIEVKTRVASRNFLIIPEENINKSKLHKLNKIISFYLKKHNLWSEPHRIDAISILINKETGEFKLSHLENIFI